MKRNLLTCLVSTVLSFMIAFGSVCCMITGFDLTIDSMTTIALVCGVFSLVSAVLFLSKHSVILLIGSAATLGGILLFAEDALNQCLVLVNYVSHVYDKVYGWGLLSLGSGIRFNTAADFPMIIMACLISLAASFAICRRKTLLPMILLSLMPIITSLVTIDTVPDVWSLFLMIFGLLLVVLTHSSRRSDPTRGNVLTGMLALPTLLIIGLLFTAIPQESYVNEQDELRDKILQLLVPDYNTDDSTYTIFGDFNGINAERNVDLREIGSRRLLGAPVLEVTAETDGLIYLREQDYDVYDGYSWTASLDRAGDFAPSPRYKDSVGTMSITTIYDQELMLLPYYPEGGETLSGGHLLNGNDKAEYSWDVQTLPENWRDIVASAPMDTPVDVHTDARRFLALPADTKVWATALVETILSNEDTATEIADTIGAYVQGSAKYDIATEAMPVEEADFAQWFLEDSDEGYCIHFATASVVLLRAAGLEARYVVGYAFDATAGEAVTVTADQYHSWAEYYEPTLGVWIPLESTPEIVHNQISVPSTDTTDENTDNTTKPSVNTTATTATQPTQQSGTADNNQSTVKPLPVVFWWALGMTVGVLMILSIPLQQLIRRRRRTAILRKLPPNSKALRLWQQAERLAALQNQQPPEVLEQLAKKAKFSQHILTAEELQAFEEYLATARAALRTHTWYRRLYYRYILAI